MKPWEKYAPATPTEAQAGPWSKYSPAAADAPAVNEGNTKPEVSSGQTLSGLIRGTRPGQDPESTTMLDALMPRRAKAEREGAGLAGQLAARGLDLASGALGVPYAALETLAGRDDQRSKYLGGTGSFKGNLLRRDEGSIVKQMANDPSTIPSVVMTGGAATVPKLALSGAKAGIVSAGLHQGDRISRGEKASAGEAAAEVALNTALPVGLKGLGTGFKAGLGKLKTILSKFSEVDEAALKSASNPETLKAAADVTKRTGGDLSNMADDLGEKTAAMQADEAAAEASVNARRQATLEQGLQKARPWANNLDVSPFDAGKRIETAAQGTRQAAGERFQQGQDAILEGRGIGRKGVEFGGLDGNQTPFEQTVDRYLADAGVGQGGKNYGVIGNVSIPAGAINEIRAMKETFKSGLTTRDMLDQLRLVDNRLNFGGDAGGRLFAAGSQEDLAVKGLRARLADDLENQIARAAGKEKNTVLAAWHAHREAYHNTAGALEKIQDGLGAGTLNHEAYFNRIKNIGVEDLRKIAAEAKKNPDLAPTWNELRKGYFDNLIASGIKGDKVDYQAIKKTWDAMDDDLKTTMMPTKVISHIDGVLDRTAPLDFKGQRIGDQNRWVGRDRQSSLSAIENIGSKAKRSDLEDLQTLDDLLGLEGSDRLSEQAGSFYLGKQLGMTEKGSLPLFTGSRNGARLTGALVGGSLGAAAGGSQGGTEGGVGGSTLGMIAGIALQSPAGALAAYKLLNQIRKGSVMAERNVTRPLAQKGLSGARVMRTLTTPQFGGGSE